MKLYVVTPRFGRKPRIEWAEAKRGARSIGSNLPMLSTEAETFLDMEKRDKRVVTGSDKQYSIVNRV